MVHCAPNMLPCFTFFSLGICLQTPVDLVPYITCVSLAQYIYAAFKFGAIHELSRDDAGIDYLQHTYESNRHISDVVAYVVSSASGTIPTQGSPKGFGDVSLPNRAQLVVAAGCRAVAVFSLEHHSETSP